MNILKLHVGMLLIVGLGYGQNAIQKAKELQELSGQIRGGEHIELKALEIRAKIHEPSLMYILDKPDTKIEFKEDKPQFSLHIHDPIYEGMIGKQVE